MNIEIGSVGWVDGLAFDNERDSVGLIADLGKFRNCTSKPDGDRYIISDFFGSRKGWIQYDIESGKKGHKERCVVVGRAEGGADNDRYYILVVVPTREDGEYTRVGVGVVRTGCVKKLRARVRIV